MRKKKCKKDPIECSWDDIPNRGNGTLPIIYIHTTTVIYQNGCFVVNPVLLLVIFLWVLYEFFFYPYSVGNGFYRVINLKFINSVVFGKIQRKIPKFIWLDCENEKALFYGCIPWICFFFFLIIYSNDKTIFCFGWKTFDDPFYGN